MDKVLREDLGGHNDDVMEVVVSLGRLDSSQSQSEYEPSEADSASQDEGCGSQSETGSKQRVLIVYEEKLKGQYHRGYHDFVQKFTKFKL